jgi:hypothetical protein
MRPQCNYVNPEIYLVDTPGILTPNIPNIEAGMRLSLCGCLPDHLVGEQYIVDYMLFWLNKHNSFSYVDIFGLTEPTDNVLSFLSHVAKKEKMVKASMFGMLGVNIPGVSTRYISGSKCTLIPEFTDLVTPAIAPTRVAFFILVVCILLTALMNVDLPVLGTP